MTLLSYHDEHSFSELLPYWRFYNDYLYTESGCVLSGFELRGFDFDTMSDETLAYIRNKIILFMHSIPQEVELQFLFQVRPFSPVMDQFIIDTKTNTPKNLRFIWEESSQYLLKNTNIWHTKLYLFMNLKYEEKGGQQSHISKFKNSFLGASTKDVIKFQSEWFNERNNEMAYNMAQIKSALVHAGFQFRELTQVDIRHILYEVLNPSRYAYSKQIPYDSALYNPKYVREEVTQSSLQVFPREFVLDDIVHRVLSLEDIPQRQSIGSILPLLGIREFPFDLIVGVEQHSKNNVLKELRQVRNVNQNMASGTTRNESAEHEYSILQDTIERIVQGEEKVFKQTFQVHYWANSDADLREYENTLRSALLQCAESKEIREEFSYPWAFLGCLPGGFYKVKKNRCMEMLTQQALSLIPMTQKAIGAKRPVVMLKTQTDELVGLDPFNPALSAYNAIIVGPSGRGKSFLAQYLLLHYARLNPHMIIVDIGGSYRRLTQLLNGQYIELSCNSKTGLNPFFTHGSTLDPIRLGEMAGIVERMVKDNSAVGIDRITQYCIRHAITLMFELYPDECNFITLQRIFSELSEQSSHDSEDADIYLSLSKRILLWIEGEARELLVSDNQISFDNSMITIDLAGIPSSGDLQAVVMQILASIIRYQVANISGPKFILFDEAWKHLADATAASVLDELYRTARKHYASVYTIVQDFEVFLTSDVKTSIIKNSETRFILQTVEELPLIEQLFKLNHRELDLIKGMVMQRGQYSEVFTMVGSDHQVLMVESTPWIYWMCTTHPPELEVELYMRSKIKKVDSVEHIRILADLFPQGLLNMGVEEAKKKIDVTLNQQKGDMSEEKI